MWWVSPFGNLRIKGLSHLPTAYRSVTRPSSPLNAKASIECPFALDCVNAQEYGYLFLSLRLCFFYPRTISCFLPLRASNTFQRLNRYPWLLHGVVVISLNVSYWNFQ
jgi:hypothetical protein